MAERFISSLSRRNFLLAVGAGGVAATMTPARDAKATRRPATKARRAGYSVSAHVDKYYRSAKL